jgi:hypothetical protein
MTGTISEMDISTLRQDLVAPFFQQSSQNLGIVGGVYRIATQRGTKRRLKPIGSRRVGENGVNARQITWSQGVAHSKLLTPLRSQLHQRSRFARRSHPDRRSSLFALW